MLFLLPAILPAVTFVDHPDLVNTPLLIPVSFVPILFLQAILLK